MTLEEYLRPAIETKAETSGEPGTFDFDNCPDVSGVVGTEPSMAKTLSSPARVNGWPLSAKFIVILLEVVFPVCWRAS